MKIQSFPCNILLSGSYARGTQTELSDIDLVFISDSVSLFHTETIYTGSTEVQIVMFPKTKVHRIMMEESNDSNGIIVSMLKSCVIIADEDGFANKLTSYVDRYQTNLGEQNKNSHLNSLRDRCYDLQHSKDKLEKELLVSAIIVLLSHILSKNPLSGTKYSIKVLSKSPYRSQIEELIDQYHKDRDETAILSFCERILDPFAQDIKTTGLTMNNHQNGNPFMIFFPEKKISDDGMENILKALTGIAGDCQIFAFRQDKWQAMNEGTYVYIRDTGAAPSDIYGLIRNYDTTISRNRLALGIEMSYPYFTSFNSGVFFGGREVLERLEKPFSSLWKAWCRILSSVNYGHSANYSFFAGAIVASKLGLFHKQGFGSLDTFYSNIAWLLLPDVVNPNGFCNVEQTARLKISALKEYARQADVFLEKNTSLFDEVLSGKMHELDEICMSVQSLIDALSLVDTDSLHYPDVYPFEHVEDIFLSVINTQWHQLYIDVACSHIRSKNS